MVQSKCLLRDASPTLYKWIPGMPSKLDELFSGISSALGAWSSRTSSILDDWPCWALAS
jgi:hypothetical protein